MLALIVAYLVPVVVDQATGAADSISSRMDNDVYNPDGGHCSSDTTDFSNDGRVLTYCKRTVISKAGGENEKTRRGNRRKSKYSS